MTTDWSTFLPDAKSKSEEELEVEAEIPDHLGGNAQRRAGAKVELRRRERAAAEALAVRQLAIAERQAQAAKWAVLAAWGGAVVTLLVGTLPLINRLIH
jgi:hypothetical protein